VRPACGNTVQRLTQRKGKQELGGAFFMSCDWGISTCALPKFSVSSPFLWQSHCFHSFSHSMAIACVRMAIEMKIRVKRLWRPVTLFFSFFCSQSGPKGLNFLSLLLFERPRLGTENKKSVTPCAGEPFRDNTKFSSNNRRTPWKMRPRCPNGCHGVTVQVLYIFWLFWPDRAA